MAEQSAKPKNEREEKVAALARAQALREKADQTALGRSLGGFMDFVRTQGVVGLAVGLAIGSQANATVKSIVDGLINPIVSFIVGSKNLSQNVWHVVGKDVYGAHPTNYWFTLGDRQLVVMWGAILSSLITLLAVAAVIYYVVKGLKLDKLDKKKEDK